MNKAQRAPFQYFGGKSSVAETVWSALGGVGHYVEPFFGSGAVLLARPGFNGQVETVNDADAYVANFWRAVQRAPDAVADLMNWPINEADLESRHKWLVTAARKHEHAERMCDDPDYYDVKIAAYWCWGLCAWIGCGWCAGEWHGRGSDESHGRGTHGGDCAKLPHLSDAGQGVHRKLPHLGDAGRGECARRGQVLRDWMGALCDRLRGVRVCCGDWARVCNSEAALLHAGSPCGVFLDPPYSAEANRDMDIYRVDCGKVAHDVREWCAEWGRRPDMRIVLCGYEGEHDSLESAGWSVVEWKAHGGYAHQNGAPESRGKLNCRRERLWLSPYCLREPTLFEA